MSDKSSPRPPPNNNEYSNPLTNIIIGEKYQSSNYSVVTTPQRNFLRNEPVSIRINCNVIGGFRQWCKFSGFQLGEATSKAMLEYMQNHPQAQVRLTVAQDIRGILPDTKTTLKLKMVKQELRVAIDLISGCQPHQVKGILPRLRKALNKAFACHVSDDELNELLERAGGYLK